MQKPRNQPRYKTALAAAAIFLCVYLLSLVSWLQVKDYYGYAVTYIASKGLMLIKDVRLEEMTLEKDVIQPTFSHLRHDNVLIDIPIKTSTYIFNAPLTFAIMAALYLFITRRPRAYAEALLMLLLIHLLFVFSLGAKELTEIFIDRKLEKMSLQRLFAYQFLWGFVDNMAIRFEPFLIGFYIFIRFRRTDKTRAGNQPS